MSETRTRNVLSIKQKFEIANHLKALEEGDYELPDLIKKIKFALGYEIKSQSVLKKILSDFDVDNISITRSEAPGGNPMIASLNSAHNRIDALEKRLRHLESVLE